MTEIFVHTLEVVIVVLVLIKLLQVRSLYLRSRPTKTPTNLEPEVKIQQRTTRRDIHFIPQSRDTLCLKGLPLPEVSFTPTKYADDVKQTKTKIEGLVKPKQDVSNNKCALSSYIDDFFAQDLVNPTNTNNTVTNKQREKASSEEDEFITIQEENAKIVKNLQFASRTTKLAS